MADWPIFVLTLHGDDARRAPLMAQLAAAGLTARLHHGIDGRHGLPSAFEPLVDRATAQARLGRAMTDGEFACALSHRAICRRLLDEGLPGAIVLEDDAILRPGFAALIGEADLAPLPLVLIDHAFARAVRFTRRPLGAVSRHRVATNGTMANAYFVNRQGAEALLRAATPVSHPADWPCCLHRLGAWMLAPRLAGHEPPGQGRVSHLDAGRDGAAAAHQPRRLVRPDARAWLRRKLSVRVGRDRGQR